jgi:hypothetical protein
MQGLAEGGGGGRMRGEEGETIVAVWHVVGNFSVGHSGRGAALCRQLVDCGSLLASVLTAVTCVAQMRHCCLSSHVLAPNTNVWQPDPQL